MTTDTTHITKDQSEARKAEVPETEALKPCPFCGGKCDPEGWIGDKKRSGPACDDCGSAAETVAIWNTRAAELTAQSVERASPAKDGGEQVPKDAPPEKWWYAVDEYIAFFLNQLSANPLNAASKLTDHERTLICGNIRAFGAWQYSRYEQPLASHDAPFEKHGTK